MDEQENDRASRPPQLRFEGRSSSLGWLLPAGTDQSEAPPIALTFPPGLELMTDVSGASWAEERLMRHPFTTVGALVPDAFESYARVLHPAYRRVGDREEAVTWAAVRRGLAASPIPSCSSSASPGSRPTPMHSPTGVAVPKQGKY